MTVNKLLAEFANTFNHRIESAKTCVDDASAFLSVNQEIELLMTEQWPQLADALEAADLAAEDRASLQAMMAAIAELHTLARARLVWANDFEDYMRDALTRR